MAAEMERKELIGQKPLERIFGEKAEFKMSLSFCAACRSINGVLNGNWRSQGRGLLWEGDKRFNVRCDKLLEP